MADFNWGFFLELLVSGVLIGLMYSLIALGFVLIYKSTDAINFAQGEFVMIAGIIVGACAASYGLPLWLAISLSVGFMVLFNVGLERTVLRPMIGRPIVAIIMATIGLAALLRGAGPFFFGAETRPLNLPIDDAPIIIGDHFIYLNPIHLLGAVAAVLFLLGFGWFFLKSRKGVAMRAVADSHQVSMAMGINVQRYFALAWVMAGVVAGARRRHLGQSARRRYAARDHRPQGVPGGDPGRARLDCRRHRRRHHRGRRREPCRRLSRPDGGRRHQGLHALCAHDPDADVQALRALRQADHREDLIPHVPSRERLLQDDLQGGHGLLPAARRAVVGRADRHPLPCRGAVVPGPLLPVDPLPDFHRHRRRARG